MCHEEYEKEEMREADRSNYSCIIYPQVRKGAGAEEERVDG